MNFSYWELKTWLRDIDFAVVGSGIVGLSCALNLRKMYPKSKIVVFEKGMLPSGASTKNAGFACFGSLSEILADLEINSQEEVVALVSERIDGLKMLRENLGDDLLQYQMNGGHELFTLNDAELFETCRAKMDSVNKMLRPVFNDDVFKLEKNKFNFQNILSKLIFTKFEGQIDTGKMMLGLIQKSSKENILILNNAEITSFSHNSSGLNLQLNKDIELSAKKMLIATNGFAQQFLKEDVKPARAQVLITKPIKNLKIKGTFHLDRGYYYFRNIDDRILFGGGRNLDFKSEETTQNGLTSVVQNSLEALLQHTILPNLDYEIDTRWSGIMGVGKTKKPILKQVSQNVYCGVRMGGMGVAIGSSVGQQLAKLTSL